MEKKLDDATARPGRRDGTAADPLGHALHALYASYGVGRPEPRLIRLAEQFVDAKAEEAQAAQTRPRR